MNGFYPVLNEVHDKAARDLPLAECALFEHIWRKLIGWNKFEDEISITQLVDETSASRATIIRLIKKLEDKRWIIVTRHFTDTNKIGIPRCPSIIMRLADVDWSQIDTAASVKMILELVSKRYQCWYQNDTYNRSLLKTSLKDSLKTSHTTVNKVTTGEVFDEKSRNGGDGFLVTEEKTKEEFEKARKELGYLQVDEPARSELAAKYETRYLFRQIAQIKKDYEKKIVFNNPGGALVARIRRGHRTEDYPE